MYLGFGSSLSIFLYHGAMTGISNSMDEAAIIDGANKFQVFWKIIFPLLKPISVTVGILNVIWIWNDYLLPSLILSDSSATIPIKNVPVLWSIYKTMAFSISWVNNCNYSSYYRLLLCAKANY